MPSARGKEDDLSLLAEHGRDARNVRQVAAARRRVIRKDHIAVLNGLAKLLCARNLVAHGKRHAAKVHGQVRRIGHQVARRREEGAGEVETQLDVDAAPSVRGRRPDDAKR
jgi:hypothetical protein